MYRRRRDRICPHAFHPVHRCRNWVRIAVVSTLDHPNLAAPASSCSVGALYFYSGDSIRKHTANGLETALGQYILVFKPLEILNPNDPSQVPRQFYSSLRSQGLPRVRFQRCLLSRQSRQAHTTARRYTSYTSRWWVDVIRHGRDLPLLRFLYK